MARRGKKAPFRGRVDANVRQSVRCGGTLAASADRRTIRPVKPRAITGFLALLPLLAACGRPSDTASPTPTGAPGAPAAAGSHPEHGIPGEASRGEPDAASVKRLMRQRAGDLRRCYESALARDARARGKLTLRFTIAPSGAIERVAAERSTFARRDVPACIEEVVRRWTTPFRPAEPVEIEYPFSFSPR